jgi:hypothetical protein
MPTMYFDICENGQSAFDASGLDVPHLANAKEEAALALIERLCEPIPPISNVAIEVTIRNEERRPIARLSLSLTVEDLN